MVLDFVPGHKVLFIPGYSFFATGKEIIDIVAGQLAMREHNKIEVFVSYHALNLPYIYEKLSTIIMAGGIVELQLGVPEDPLERLLVCHKKDKNPESTQIETFLNLEMVEPHKWRVEPLERELGRPLKPSIKENPKLELITLSAHLRFAFFVKIKLFLLCFL